MNSESPKGITFQQDIYPKVLSLLPANRSARILDVGAGEGYFCGLVSERGYRVEACDYRKSLFKLPDVPFYPADLSKGIPLPDESFDCIVSIEVIEHIENHTQFMKELMRVAKKGGTIIVTTPNILSVTSRWHYFLFGYTDCAPRPLDPLREDYHLQHINPIGLPEILFLLERFGGEMAALETNRIRRSAWLPAILLYPVFALALRLKLRRKEYADLLPLYRRHIRWMLTPANLMGRITIAVGRRVK